MIWLQNYVTIWILLISINGIRDPSIRDYKLLQAQQITLVILVTEICMFVRKKIMISLNATKIFQQNRYYDTKIGKYFLDLH